MEEVLAWDALYVPQTFKGFSTFFGVAAFSYGATIIIPEIQASRPCPSFGIPRSADLNERVAVVCTEVSG